MVTCPRCDGQGYIYRGKIVDKLILFICDECDACWENQNDIRIETFQDLTVFLKGKEILFTPKDIENIGYIS